MLELWKLGLVMILKDLGKCKFLELINERMCKKYQAQYYLKNFEVSEEMNLYSNNYFLPELDTTQQWCNPGKSLTLLGIQGSTFLQIGVFFLFSTSLFLTLI